MSASEEIAIRLSGSWLYPPKDPSQWQEWWIDQVAKVGEGSPQRLRPRSVTPLLALAACQPTPIDLTLVTAAYARVSGVGDAADSPDFDARRSNPAGSPALAVGDIVVAPLVLVLSRTGELDEGGLRWKQVLTPREFEAASGQVEETVYTVLDDSGYYATAWTYRFDHAADVGPTLLLFLSNGLEVIDSIAQKVLDVAFDLVALPAAPTGTDSVGREQ